jgi:hypothetical protein
MRFITANATGKGTAPARGAGRRLTAPWRCGFVEDLNWPVPDPTQRKKPARPIEVWAPGPVGSWEGDVPRIQ